MSHDDEETLVRRHLPAARRVAWAAQPLLGALDPDELESAAQIALLRCLRSYRPGCGVPLPAYLHSVIRRRVIDALRESGVVSRSGKRGKHELLDGDATEPARYEWGLERREAFDDLVRPLSSSQRAVIVGCYRDGRSLRDIASEIGLDPSTCSIIRKQSLEFLRYRLGAQQSA